MKKFPNDFKWGTATSAYQVEGGNDNSNWEVWAKNQNITSAGIACDSFKRYPEDIELMKSINLNSYRFSIEWARIEPQEGMWDIKALDYYKDLIIRLNENGIEPFVTLFHFTLPLWVEKIGGFENKQTIKYFVRFSEFIAENLQGNVKYFITINEPVLFASLSYLRGYWPPCKKNVFKFFAVKRNLEKAHIGTYRKIKEIYEKYEWDQPQISVSQNISYLKSMDIISFVYCKLLDYILNYSFLDHIKDYLDFIGLNFYFYEEISLFHKNVSLHSSVSIEYSDKNNKQSYNFYPESIFNVLQVLYKRYKKDIYITENGISDPTDKIRSKYINEYLSSVYRAIKNGIPVKGYFYWTLIDNFEWLDGFNAKFGLAFIKNEKRILKRSGKDFSNIVKRNGLL
ncbi:family 1 glycosylhydrolase [Patescibacteria group bacterium]|nr:family 1 glycosylhydrolase [Patescibacteria group bacterium]